MLGVWVKEIEDIVNLARQIGFMMSYKVDENTHIYYVRASGGGEQVHYILTARLHPIKGKFVSLDDEGNLKVSDKPILPFCAKITEVVYDCSLTEILKKWKERFGE